MENRDLQQEFSQLFGTWQTWREMSDKLDTLLQGHSDPEEYRELFCYRLLHDLSTGYCTYGDLKEVRKWELVSLLIENISKLPEEKYYYHGVSAFFCGEYERCIAQLKLNYSDSVLKERDSKYQETDIFDELIEPFKNVFPGFWSQVQKLIYPLCRQDGTEYLCQLMADYYACRTDEEAVDILTAYIQTYPHSTLAREYLACTYYDLKMWNNTIAYLQTVGRPILFMFTRYQIYFMMAWSYGKIRNFKREESCYRACLRFYPQAENALNNLGYCLYKQRRYQQAKEVFEQCLKEGRDLPYAANNYVQVLIALGQYTQARKFAATTGVKLSKGLRERINKLPEKNMEQPQVYVREPDEDVGDTAAEKTIDMGGKREQFSSEKLLEDELTLRIESGQPVFGMKLTIYKRPGEYGRQYIIPIGRLDLLCEDKAGNLYIIELKKDSGYDDVYRQITDYLDWFEQSPQFRNRSIYGIICLNNPTQKLISQVHSDSRLRLFEYGISYQEI